MYLMDRNEKKSPSQSFLLAVENAVNLYPFPVCAHDQYGNFFAFNPAFLNEFGEEMKSDSTWIECIGFDALMVLRQRELQIHIERLSHHIEKSVYTNLKNYDILLEKLASQFGDCFLWKFGTSDLHARCFKRPLPLHKDIEDFVRNVRLLDRNEYNFLSLYARGASHKLISNLLGSEYGSSRNKSSSVLKKLNISNRDDAFIVSHISELMESLSDNARKLILKNVNKL